LRWINYVRHRGAKLATMGQYDWIFIIGVATVAATVGLLCAVVFTLL